MAINVNQYVPNLPQFYTNTGNGAMASNVLASSNDLRWVQGEVAAKNYSLIAPGQTLVLFDSEESKFYIKSIGYNGVPAPLRKFRYEEEFDIPAVEEKKETEYVTKDDLNEAMDKIASMISSMKPKYEKRGGRNDAKPDLRRDEER